MTALGGREGDGQRLWLIRHASTPWTGRRFCGRTDVPLSKAGRAEAAVLAGRLATIVPEDALVISAPAGRARETAEVLHASLRGRGVVELDHRLREVDFGQAEGLTFDRIAETMPDLADAIAAGVSVDWPGGDSAASVRERAAGVWLDVSCADPPRLLVTHGGFIRAFLDVAFGRPAMRDVWVRPAAAIELSTIAGRWQAVGP